ncbi:enoyl-CoA hydratase/isomerase family protein, partial [Vibrio parahaemolyticus VPTS-2010]
KSIELWQSVVDQYYLSAVNAVSKPLFESVF